jgi:branched-chain amino acid transport system substrate-binding protein
MLSIKKTPPGFHAGNMDHKPIDGIAPPRPDEEGRASLSGTTSAKGPILKQIALLILFAVSLHGCGTKEPIRIGFVTGTTGHMADMGVEARYGIRIALDQCNEKGGIHGRRVELIVRDDQANAEAVVKDVQELIAQKVDAVIGPMSSTIAMAIVPYLNESRMITVSPTATTPLLSGRDDYFFRVCSIASVYARLNAEYQIRSGNMRRITVALYGGNPSFCEPFMEDFKNTFTAGGGNILSIIKFTANDGRSFSRIADELLQADPDGILIIANAMDSAMLCQQIRKISPSVNLTLSPWSNTQRFIELGGKAVEGVTLATSVDWDSLLPQYQHFRKILFDRYGRGPSISNFNAYNAARVVLTALNSRKPGRSLKDTILSLGEFEGLQGKIRFDAYGDVKNAAFMRIIRNHKFAALE